MLTSCTNTGVSGVEAAHRFVLVQTELTAITSPAVVRVLADIQDPGVAVAATPSLLLSNAVSTACL